MRHLSLRKSQDSLSKRKHFSAKNQTGEKEYQKQNVLFFEECISEWAYETAQEEFESREELYETIKSTVKVDKAIQEVL